MRDRKGQGLDLRAEPRRRLSQMQSVGAVHLVSVRAVRPQEECGGLNSMCNGWTKCWFPPIAAGGCGGAAVTPPSGPAGSLSTCLSRSARNAVATAARYTPPAHHSVPIVTCAGASATSRRTPFRVMRRWSVKPQMVCFVEAPVPHAVLAGGGVIRPALASSP